MIRMKSVAVLLSSAAMALCGSHAWAQSDVSVDANDGARGSFVTANEIIVTAQKQAESLQDTSAAITALGGEDLVSSGVTNIRDLQAFVPSVRLQKENSATQVFIRGVGQGLNYPQFDPPGAINFNGVYIPREATGAPFNDVAQVEVLPGPQGTLYGRSSLAGVVNVNFKRPSFEFETEALAEIGNYDMYHVSLAQNIPLSDTLAVRAAADYSNRDGYLKSGADADDTLAARLSLLWEPSDDFTAFVWGHVIERDGAPPNLVARGVDSDGNYVPNAFLQDDPWNDLLPDDVLPLSPFGQVQAGDLEYKNWMVAGQFDLDLTDSISVSYIPSYLDFSHVDAYWINGLPGRKFDYYEQTTHELRFNGEAGWGDWLLGLYGYRMESGGSAIAGTLVDDGSGIPIAIVDKNVLKGISAFGQLTFDLSDSVRLIAGGRFSADNRTANGSVGLTGATYEVDESYKNVDFKAGFEFDAAPEVMLYGAIQTGYAPGSFNPFPGGPDDSNLIAKSNLVSYTLGQKGRFLDGTLQFNTEFFYYDYKDLGLGGFDLTRLTVSTYNAEKVRIYGNQTDIIVRPGPNDQVSINVGYLNARFKTFNLPASAPGGPASFAGNALPYAPDWTINVGYHHDFQMASGYLRVQGLMHFESEFYPDFIATPGSRQKPYTKSDASITYYADSGKWDLGIWIKNIEDEPVNAANAAGTQFPATTFGGTTYIEAPRTYGVRLGLHL